MPIEPGDFPGSRFKLRSVVATGIATVRCKYTQDPRKLGDGDAFDSLTVGNYTLTGPTLNYVVSTVQAADDPQAVDLYVAAPLEIGNWTLAVANVRADNNALLEAPTSLPFVVVTLPLQDPVSKGAQNEPSENLLRKFFNPGLKGPAWDAILYALGQGDKTHFDNAQKTFSQLSAASASGKYLDQRLGDIGIERPDGLALSDSLYRGLGISLTRSKLTQQSVMDVLEVFYGAEAIRGYISSNRTENYALEDLDDLKLLIDETTVVTVTFQRAEFARLGAATALEVASAITRHLKIVRSQAYAAAIADEITGKSRVRIYSGRTGTSSSIRVVGGRAQPKLRFPNELYVEAGVSPFANWTVAVSAVNPGRFRWTHNSGGYDLNKLQIGDKVYIYGQEFSALNRGTFEITDVQVFYNPGLVQYFEIENVFGVAQAATNQLTWGSVMFFRPNKYTIYSTPRRALVSQTPGHNDIIIPATTQAVIRKKTTGAYAQVNTAVAISSVLRTNASTVDVVTATAHGLTVDGWAYIDGVLPRVLLPTISAGVPSGTLP